MHRDFARSWESWWFFGSARAEWHNAVASQYEEVWRFPDAFTEEDLERFEQRVTRAMKDCHFDANPPRVERSRYDEYYDDRN